MRGIEEGQADLLSHQDAKISRQSKLLHKAEAALTTLSRSRGAEGVEEGWRVADAIRKERTLA